MYKWLAFHVVVMYIKCSIVSKYMYDINCMWSTQVQSLIQMWNFVKAGKGNHAYFGEIFSFKLQHTAFFNLDQKFRSRNCLFYYLRGNKSKAGKKFKGNQL